MAERRTSVDGSELNRLMTDEFHRRTGGKEGSITFQYRLVDADDIGCNWSTAYLRAGSKEPSANAIRIANEVVDWARGQYNLKEITVQ